MNFFPLEQTAPVSSLNKTYEGLMAQGNGYFHVRGNFEEGLAAAEQNLQYLRSMESVTTEIPKHSLSKYGTYIPLIMGKHPLLREVIVNLPYFMDIRPIADGETLDMLDSTLTEFSRSLSLREGELTRSFHWHTRSGAVIALRYRRFASGAEKRLFVQSVDCQVVEGNPIIHWESGIDGGVTTSGYKHWETLSFKQKDDAIVCQFTVDTGFQVAMESYHRFATPVHTVPNQQKERSFLCWEQTDKNFSFEKRTTLATRRDCEQPAIAVEKALRQVDNKTYRQLRSDSRKVWDTRWRQSRILTKENPSLQLSLDQAIYHLLRCNTGDEDRIQVCAKGFAGEAYYGRYFWDSEIYLLPFYLYTNPSAARSLLMYRYHTLEGAKKNAQRYHAKGARYPWQSGLTGEEQCSLWEYADNEIHITADIAYAIAHYYQATDDFAFLVDYGLELLIETARYWPYRVDYDEKGTPHLLNVMGPDEYSPMTKDNSFTNFMVSYHLKLVVELAEEIKQKDPAAYETLRKKLGYTEKEGESFLALAKALPIPYDDERMLYLQSADFEEYAAIDIEDLWKDKSRPFGFSVTQEKIYRSRCIKQADVIALMTLFPNEFTQKQVQAAYDYYLPLTVHDSSLSPAGHSLVAHRLNRDEDTRRFLEQSLAVDFVPEDKGAEEGIHIANCGCLWQLFVFGFAGIESALWQKEMTVRPKLPKGIEHLELPMQWKGRHYRIVLSKDEKPRIAEEA